MRFVILIVIMIVAVAAGFLAMRMVDDSPKPATQAVAQQAASSQVNAVQVLVARNTVQLGTVITEDMIERQPWPQHLVVDGFVVSGRENDNIVGMVARADFQKNEPFSTYKLARPNDSSFLAAALPSGMRAITIPVDAVSGIAGYVFPGDRVDVIMTHNVPDLVAGERTDDRKPKYSEFLIQNVRVIAVDLRSGGGVEKEQTRTAPRAPATLTLEVTAEDAQRIRLAEKAGMVSLALRSLKDHDKSDAVSPTTLSDLSAATGAGGGSAGTVIVVRGTKSSTERLTNVSGEEQSLAPVVQAPVPPHMESPEGGVGGGIQ